ncbi:MAG: hypothetical protein UW64_C0030G0007 [Microgenomates group bacterium GW2011_GWC1_44_37]|uniref:Polymorphic outer membrane protein n=1 Tax=Candidatus Collierbacteria bacterium GW2011_GWB2_44_22 TaxID=1618387 RepID=A0A0G1KVV4_9BACT|nr:MAG: hypothetical protein UW44_C0005G0096 [Candidatus Collierbacteria bacterium GW2011_GWB2_44_22]KKT68059.1 MAG: hypothetical protein UW64_C0030G0007 [Microgenomates group bacterium GW2011_GWC1_44_37]
MRKEVLLAIIFGVILGGVILYGINLANKSVSNTPTEKTVDSQITPTPTVTGKSLSIVSPQNHSVTSDKILSLTGRAGPSSNLAIISELDDLIIEASPEGTFSAQINLIGGENTISITELQNDLTTKTETITIIQTPNLPE